MIPASNYLEISVDSRPSLALSQIQRKVLLNIWRILQLTKARQPRMLAGAAAHFYGFVSFLKHSDVSSQPALVCNVLYLFSVQSSGAKIEIPGFLTR